GRGGAPRRTGGGADVPGAARSAPLHQRQLAATSDGERFVSRQVTPIPKKATRRSKNPSPATLKRKATVLWGRYIHARDKVCYVCGRSDEEETGSEMSRQV